MGSVGANTRGYTRREENITKSPIIFGTAYDELDDTQGMTTKRIPTAQIEIKNRDGEWESLSDYARRYWRSFGIRRG